MIRPNQPAIFEPAPPQARYISFAIGNSSEVRDALRRLSEMADGDSMVVGIGMPVMEALNASIDGLRVFPNFADTNSGIAIPANQQALWCWLRGTDLGDLAHQGRRLIAALSAGFEPTAIVDAFRHGANLDLTGYEDGTENPQDEDATSAALVQQKDASQDGGSFVAVQQWVHDFERFDAMTTNEQDNAFGRRRSDNEELEEAPDSAHVKRTAQENFDPQAFLVRRSMPWVDRAEMGFMFVAFGKTLDAFEVQMNRMSGAEDGIVDAIFQFSQPVNGAYYWCPPLRDGMLNLDVFLADAVS